MNIEVEDVSVRLPGKSDFLFTIPSLKIRFGTRVLIQGPSGKGKTTLLHLLAGQFLPEAGRIKLGDFDLTALDNDARSRIRREHFGIIFQRLNLLDHLTALENVLLGAHDFSDAAAQRSRAALSRMGLQPQALQRAGTLSPGEQQRVAVARVLAHPPDIILADEPTSSLDAVNAETVMRALCDASANRTLIVVSHDQRIHPFFETAWDFPALAGV